MPGQNSILAHRHLLVASFVCLPCLIFSSLGNSSREPSFAPVVSGNDTVNIVVHPGWNLLSLPIAVDDGRPTILFPSAVSRAYTYKGYYITRDTLSPGEAFWLKYAATETVKIVGTQLASDTIPLNPGWNMIGTVALPDTVYQSGSLDSAQGYYWRVGLQENGTTSLWTTRHSLIVAWKYVGLAGEDIVAIVFDPTNPNTIYAGGDWNLSSGLTGGVFKTTNGGGTWDTLMRGVSTADLDIDPNNPKILYVISWGTSLARAGILKTTDGGGTWSYKDSSIS